MAKSIALWRNGIALWRNGIALWRRNGEENGEVIALWRNGIALWRRNGEKLAKKWRKIAEEMAKNMANSIALYWGYPFMISLGLLSGFFIRIYIKF